MGLTIQSCREQIKLWSGASSSHPTGFIEELFNGLGRGSKAAEHVEAFNEEFMAVRSAVVRDCNPDNKEYTENQEAYDQAKADSNRLRDEYFPYFKLAKELANDPEVLNRVLRFGIHAQSDSAMAQAEAVAAATETDKERVDRMRRALLLGRPSSSVRFPAFTTEGIFWFRMVAYEGFGGGFGLAPGFMATKVDQCFRNAANVAYSHALQLSGVDNETPHLLLWWAENGPETTEPLQGTSATGAFLNAIASLLIPGAARPDGRVVVSATVKSVEDGCVRFGPVDHLGTSKLAYFLEHIEQHKDKGGEFDSLVLCGEQIDEVVAWLKTQPIAGETLRCFDLVEAETGRRHPAVNLV